jgi:hypothetical protein
MADAAGNRREPRRPESSGQQGRPTAFVGGGAVDVADAMLAWKWRDEWQGQAKSDALADSDSAGCCEQWQRVATSAPNAAIECPSWWSAEPEVGRVAHGVASRVDRLRCLGNGQVPLCAAVAFAQLADRVGLSIGRNTYEFARRKIESENAAIPRGERGAAPWATD